MTARTTKWVVLAFLLSVEVAEPSAIAVPRPASGDLRVGKPLFKGVEMYSWKSRDAWNFSLVIGTNRNKTKVEVTSPSVTIVGIHRLKAKLATLAVGEEVFWSNFRGKPFGYPSTAIVKDLEEFCRLKKIRLTVGGR